MEKELHQDHVGRISFILSTSDHKYIVYCQRKLIPASHRVIEGVKKKRGGVLQHFKKTIFVPPYDVITVKFADRKIVWEGTIEYELHNVSRKKATKDDTWSKDHFNDTLQYQIQFPGSDREIEYVFTPKDLSLLFEIKKKKGDGATVLFNKPIRLEKSQISVPEFKEMAVSIRSDIFRRHCMAGRIELVG